MQEQREQSSAQWKSREEMDEGVREQYGKEIAELLAKRASVLKQSDLVKELRKHGLNGDAETLAHKYLLHLQEFDRNESWYKRWTKQILALPGKAVRWTWEKMKAHPYLTALALIGLVGGGIALVAYATGNWELLMATIGMKHIRDAFNAARGGGGITDGVFPNPFKGPGGLDMVKPMP